MIEHRFAQIFQYNAFTEQPFAGNPAGVVLDAAALDPQTMQQIARQLNLAETAFLTSPTKPDADVRLRWFTPALEVDLCGHATIAAFTAAAEHGLFPVATDAERTLRVETLSGVLRIRISRKAGATRVAMQLPLPSFADIEIDRSSFAALWNVTEDELSGEWLRHEALDYWYLSVSDRRVLNKLTLNSERLAEIDPRAAFTFFTTDTIEPQSDWHLRFFAPFHGVDEDIVTGSAQGPMGLVHLKRFPTQVRDGWCELRGEQGDLLGRPGRVSVRVEMTQGIASDLEIAGSAVRMLEGRIRV